MGSMYVEIEGEQWCEWEEGYPRSLKKMEMDIDEITEDFHRGCPNDLNIGPMYE